MGHRRQDTATSTHPMDTSSSIIIIHGWVVVLRAGDAERRRPSARRAVVSQFECCPQSEENTPKTVVRRRGVYFRNEPLRTAFQ
jgi:hypothetical protein